MAEIRIHDEYSAQGCAGEVVQVGSMCFVSEQDVRLARRRNSRGQKVLEREATSRWVSGRCDAQTATGILGVARALFVCTTLTRIAGVNRCVNAIQQQLLHMVRGSGRLHRVSRDTQPLMNYN
uniref:Uncharacterized protein n=1 Tax=Parascaris univalens TaxID=6257 RepID=A0A915BQX8_PARUN